MSSILDKYGRIECNWCIHIIQSKIEVISPSVIYTLGGELRGSRNHGTRLGWRLETSYKKVRERIVYTYMCHSTVIKEY